MPISRLTRCVRAVQLRSMSYVKVDNVKNLLQTFVVVTSKAYFTYVVARVMLWDGTSVPTPMPSSSLRRSLRQL